VSLPVGTYAVTLHPDRLQLHRQSDEGWSDGELRPGDAELKGRVEFYREITVRRRSPLIDVQSARSDTSRHARADHQGPLHAAARVYKLAAWNPGRQHRGQERRFGKML